MISRAITLLLLVANAGAAPAAHRHTSEPDTQDHDGVWQVRMEDGRGGRWTGRLEVRDFAGTWNVAPAKGPRDARCDKPTPITVQASHADDLDFTVWGTSVAPHCKDLTLELVKRDDGRLEATLADGRKVELTRRPEKRSAKK